MTSPLPGERVARDGAFSSRHESGEGLVCPHRDYPRRLTSRTRLTPSLTNPYGIGGQRRGQKSFSYRLFTHLTRLRVNTSGQFAGPPMLEALEEAPPRAWPRKRPLTRHAPAGKSAGARHPLPSGEG